MHSRLLISLILFVIGNIFMILAFQIPVKEGDKVPEYLYDMLSIGLFLFSSAPFILITGLCKKFKNQILSLCRIPAALGSFFTLFNMGKEVAGLNSDYSTTQLIVFLIGAMLTLTVQYGYHQKHIGE